MLMKLKRLALLLVLVVLAVPAHGGSRRPLVLGSTGQTQQIQNGDTLVVPDGGLFGATGGPTSGMVTVTGKAANTTAIAVNTYAVAQSSANFATPGMQFNAIEEFGSFSNTSTHFGVVVNGGKAVSAANTNGSWTLMRVGYTGYGGGSSSSFITGGQAIVQPTPSAFNNTGNFTGWNPECVIVAGLSPTSCVGEEVDIQTAVAPANIRQGVRIVDIGSSAATLGAITDSGLGISKAPTFLGFRHGILFGDEGQPTTFPIAANGNLIKTGGSGAITVASGIDLSDLTNVTFTSALFSAPASKRFLCLGVPGTCGGGAIVGNTASNGGQIVFNNNSISLNWAAAALTVNNTGVSTFLGTNAAGAVSVTASNGDTGGSSAAKLIAAHGSGSSVELNAGSAYGVINSTTQSLGLQVAGVTGLTIGTDGNVYPTSGLQLSKKTAATLPTCNGASEGRMFAVTDANSAVFNAAVAAGGANHIIGYCNGTGWVVH